MKRNLITREKLAKAVDLTLLKPEATESDIARLCEEAIRYQVWSICINPVFVNFAKGLVEGTPVRICSVIGFPFGATMPEVKAMEAESAIRHGAHELDIVANVGALRSGKFSLVEEELGQIVSAVKRLENHTITKLIIECCFLEDQQKIDACQVAIRAGADFVKTSTGFGPYGATIHDVKLLRQSVGPHFGVKAAGGIRFYEDAIAMIRAGANRIGTSSAPSVLGNT